MRRYGLSMIVLHCRALCKIHLNIRMRVQQRDTMFFYCRILMSRSYYGQWTFCFSCKGTINSSNGRFDSIFPTRQRYRHGNLNRIINQRYRVVNIGKIWKSSVGYVTLVFIVFVFFFCMF